MSGFAFNSFCENLPISVDEFKEKLSINYPKLFDTKFISGSFPDLQNSISQTALGDIYSCVGKEPFQYPSYGNILTLIRRNRSRISKL